MVIDPGNAVPVANAGADIEVQDGTAVTLNGSGSFDSDGSVVEYVWLESGSIIGTGAVIGKSFDAGVHTITLTVTDDMTVTSGTVVTLDGSGSRDDGTIVVYEWQEVEVTGSAVPDNVTLELVGVFPGAVYAVEV